MTTGGFSDTTLGAVLTLQRGFDLPKKQRSRGRFPVVGSTAVQDYHNEYKVKPPGVVVGRSGSLGTVQFLDRPFWPLNTTLWVRDFGANDPHFVYYFLQTLGLETFDSGTGVPTLNRNHLDGLPVSIPSRAIQEKIAAILSAYDDLIENNLRRIEILEEMARNLYREWFLEFRFPGHEGVRWGESPLGLLPDGWRVVRLESLISKHIGGGWGKESRDSEHTEPAWVLRGTDLRTARRGDVTKVPRRWHTARNLASRQLAPGDLVLEVSGGSKGQPLGRSLQVTEEWLQGFKGEAVMCASFCKRVQAARGRIAPGLLFYGLLDARASGRMAAYEVQSTGISNLQWKRFIEGTQWLLPPTGLQSEFCGIVEPLSEEGAILGRRNAVLRTARDLLMPKLISGELDVADPRVRAAPPTRSDSDGSDVTCYDFLRQMTALPFVDKIVLFGSRARADHEEHSDIDLAVFCDDAGDDEWLEVLDCLREDRIDTLAKVDCVRFDRCDPVLQENVLEEGLVLYEKGGHR